MNMKSSITINNSKLNDLFHLCCGSTDKAELTSILKVLWSIMDNTLGIIDIATIYNITTTKENVNSLDYKLFYEFFNEISKIKYLHYNDSIDKLLDDIRNARVIKIKSSNTNFLQILDDTVIKELIKYDVTLKQIFSNFIGNGIKFGGGISWKEVKSQSLSMDIDGFKQFISTYSLIPSFGTIDEFEVKFKEMINDFPLLGSALTLNTTILFPQFQLLLALLALTITTTNQSNNNNVNIQFAAKPTKSKSAKDKLVKFFIDIGLDRKVDKFSKRASISEIQPVSYEEPLRGSIIIPQSHMTSDKISGLSEHNRQSMLLQLEQLFNEIVIKIDERIGRQLPNLVDNNIDNNISKIKLLTKPVVISDSIPIPTTNNDMIHQLLSSSLSNHNSNNYQDSLKFLETVNLQIKDLSPSILDDVFLYVMYSKGNIYRSSGDDELALTQYLHCWNHSYKIKNKDWEIISLNSIGILAYFNININVAMLCFDIVTQFRESTYGSNSVDTATAWNNQGCCLYLIGNKNEARTKFEKSWNTICEIIGQRSPRAIIVWKNLEKSRRSHAATTSSKDVIDSVTLRPDSDKLIIGGKFIIKAFPPPLEHIKSKKTLKKKKKKGKK